MRIRDGFPGQRIRVLPPEVVRTASSTGLTGRLLVTDAGYFPHALHHGRQRRRGVSGSIVIFCVSGRGWCEAAGERVGVEAGEVLVVPAGLGHVYGSDDTDPWTIWWMHVRGPDADTAVGQVCGGHARVRVLRVHDAFRLTAELTRVVELLETDETMPSLVRAAGSAWSVLASISADDLAGDPQRAEPVRQVRELLRRDPAAPVSVSALARTAGLSTSHFAALFRQATGGGVVEYSKRLRMARACELLITTTRPVGEIGGSVGYPDAQYFARQFRSVHGCTPSDFRRHHAGTSEPEEGDAVDGRLGAVRG
ncbi:AraC family transcriptional regulator [Desertihabitans brevis]|uniref:AraC family transcriptional regulator n=1 Tax=Desertihabitans brevis TaxID=2268447 RepID=A0A367YWA9_9ACTN|nr:AraC family transcriptional regulator [Desertihabitans brevis]RCK70185.1 AraC family transcriptional regulator [Desertihabitans brevis]